jgi:hypothetical protein
LLIVSPVGYRKGELRLEKDPDRRVQEAIRLVFQKLGELGSVRQTLLWFLEYGLELPVTNAHEEVRWKRPSYGMLYSMLTNPAYGGAYAYGKTEQLTQYDGGEARQAIRRKPRERWLSFILGTHDGYVSWEEFERRRPPSPRMSCGPSKSAPPSGVQRCWPGCCAVAAAAISWWCITPAVITTCCGITAVAGGSIMASRAVSALRVWSLIRRLRGRSCA